jgi:hypothetical protein
MTAAERQRRRRERLAKAASGNPNHGKFAKLAAAVDKALADMSAFLDADITLNIRSRKKPRNKRSQSTP